MIISHKYKFIFIKTYKTAGTSVELFLSDICGDLDVVTPIWPHVEPHVSRNFSGIWSPLGELFDPSLANRSLFRDLVLRRKYYNHIPARRLIHRVPGGVWNNYFKFCIERNPWDKAVSQYNMFKDKYSSFDDYISNGVSCFNSPLYTGVGGELLVDEVVRYESLGAGLAGVFERLGVPFDGELNARAKSNYRSEKAHYSRYYSDAQRRLISELFQDEINLHRYQF
jgi:hypothetical protein